jgi:xanthine dehydrogenase/oxidase
MAIVEHAIDHVADACRVNVDDVRRTNMYKVGEYTPFGMVIGNESGAWNVPTMWDRLESELNMKQRRAEIAEFNSKHKWIKRGMSLIPTKFGIAFTAKYMNQGGALVHVYQDGTVLVSHGGTEMGQGLHTKVCQVAAQAFGIPHGDVYVNDSSSDKVANSQPTAASMSTDMYGMATLDACRQIILRLAPFQEQMPGAPLKDVVKAAHFARVDLSAHGFYILDDKRCGFDWHKEKPVDFPVDAPENSWKGHPFNYFTQGVVSAEVEVDTLTGNHRTLRSDLLVDVGASINPALDIGQIEGAFVQGMGWSTIEEVTYADDDHTWIRPRGALFTSGPGTYKIPAFNDVPEVFNVSLMENVDNPFAVHSSKAVGEPPFFLGSSVFYAIKDAVKAARKQNLGDESYFEMRMPATSERIRMYCADKISEKAVSEMLGESKDVSSFQPQGSF